MGFYVRAGLWIDGIEILTGVGRKSGVFGNATGGSGLVRSLLLLLFSNKLYDGVYIFLTLIMQHLISL